MFWGLQNYYSLIVVILFQFFSSLFYIFYVKQFLNSLTISIPKSGAWPVIPNTVVFRYFSWPARSMKVMTFEELSQMCIQSRPPPLKKINISIIQWYQCFNVRKGTSLQFEYFQTVTFEFITRGTNNYNKIGIWI